MIDFAEAVFSVFQIIFGIMGDFPAEKTNRLLT